MARLVHIREVLTDEPIPLADGSEYDKIVLNIKRLARAGIDIAGQDIENKENTDENNASSEEVAVGGLFSGRMAADGARSRW